MATPGSTHAAGPTGTPPVMARDTAGGADDLLVYVRATATLLALPLDDAQVQRVAGHLARTRMLADALGGIALSADDELPEMFCPAPFPPGDAP